MTMTREAPAAGRPDAGPVEPDRSTLQPSAPLLGLDVRRTLLALLASMLGAVPLCELFLDRGWLIDVWLTMIIAVAPAAWMRRNRPPAAGQVWVGVILLVPWLTVNFVREHAVLGFIPLRGAWKDIGDLLTDLHNTTTDSVAPVHTTVAVRLAVCALLGLIAALVDLLAVVGRRGALAGVPLLIVFTVSGAVPRHPVSWVWFALAAVGFLILLALDSSDDLHRWGHYVARSRTAGRRRLGNYSGQRIAAVAILLAVALPFAIPADSRNLIANWFHNSPTPSDDFGAGENFGAGSGANGIDPFARLRGQLIRPDKLNLLEVTVSGEGVSGAKGAKPFYLRSNVLSNFTGDGWRAQSHGATQSLDDTEYGSSPGTPFAPNTVKYRADIDVTGLRSNPPIFGSPESITGVDSSTRWSPQDMLMLGGNGVDKGQSITEEVAQPAPTVSELRAATGTDASMAPWTKLDVPISDFVRRTTAAVVGNARTPYEKARRITQYFANPANNFQYSLSTGTQDNSDALTDFLRNKIGFCQQYAATMAVMLRLSDVPSRVVLGYAHPEPDADGKFTVTSYDAHAWVEAYFSGIGWIPFDPTPVEGISGGKAADLPWASHDVPSDAPSATTPNEPSVSLPARTNRPEQNQPSAPPVASSSSGGGSSAPLFAFGLVVLALVLVALVPATVRWRRRRHRLHLARAGDTAALWQELQDTATDLGYAWSPARTPRQVAAWLGGTKDDPTGALRAIAEAVERDRYAPAGGDRGGRDLVADLRTVIASLQSRRSSRERARAIFWPESLGWTRVPLPGRWVPSAAGLRRH